VETRRFTVADLAQFPDDGKLRELVDGQVVEWDVTNFEHGSLAAFLGGLLWSYSREHRLGRVVITDALVKVQDSEYDARGGDVTFYRKSRIPSDQRAAATATPPDLVIEVLSPTDRATMVEAKIADWLRARRADPLVREPADGGDHGVRGRDHPASVPGGDPGRRQRCCPALRCAWPTCCVSSRSKARARSSAPVH